MADGEDRHYHVHADGIDFQPVSGVRRFRVAAALLAGSCLVLLSVVATFATTRGSHGSDIADSTNLVGLTSLIPNKPNFITQMGRRPLGGLPLHSRISSPVAPRTMSVQAESKPAYRLCYFDIRGLAETSRMLFHMSNTPFTDIRIGMTFESGKIADFSTVQRPDLQRMKETGELDSNLGRVPYLEVDGTRFGQSKAIERYLAKQFGYYGANDLEAAIIDQLCESVADFRAAFDAVQRTEGEAEKAAALEKFFAETLPGNMQLLEKSLPACEAGPFLVGNKVSLADVVLYQFCAAPGSFNFDNIFLQKAAEAKASFQSCPRIKAAMEAVENIPELQVYIAARPKAWV